MDSPMDYFPEDVVEGFGEVRAATIEDGVSHARFALEKHGPQYALNYREELERIVTMKTWRSREAAQLLLKIYQGLAREQAELIEREFVSASKGALQMVW